MILDQLTRPAAGDRHSAAPEPGAGGCAERVDRTAAVARRLSGRASRRAVLRESRLWTPSRRSWRSGASTIYNVILIQRDLAQSQSDEVNALSSYSKAKVQMDVATGQTLERNDVSIAEAFTRIGFAATVGAAPPETRPERRTFHFEPPGDETAKNVRIRPNLYAWLGPVIPACRM